MQGYALNESNYINSMQGITTIKNFNKQSFFQKMNQLVFGNFQNKIVNLGKINVRLSLFAGFSGVLFLMAILSFTSLKVFQKEMQLGELMAVLGIAGSLLPSITNLALISIPFNEAKIAFNRMFEFTSISKEKQGTISLIEFESLEISNLSFRFAGRSQLLKNIHLSVKRGQLNAIVGESGSGKSTIGQILQKFYDFENGNIFINKTINFRELQLNDWRDLVGVVPQEITIFNGNVLDNMLLGEEDTPEKILSFFKEYGFEEFINNLPQGFATILGEEGINLSGGQKQLIALARVLYKKPQFLILDEATAAMDKKTEEFCIQLISKIKNNMGILFISHRLETLKKYADIIYVLENGEIITQGNHHQLLKTDNFYSNFWKEII